MVIGHEDVTDHERATSVEENLNNQMEKMPYSVDVSQVLSLVNPSLPNGLMNKMAMASEMEVIYELNNMDFCSRRLICLQSLLNAQPANKETNSEPHYMAPVPKRMRPGDGLIIVHWTTSILEEAVLGSYWK